MARVSAYQRRKREIAYLEYRGKQLEEIIYALGQRMADHGVDPVIPLTGSGVCGDDPITDVTTGDFAMRFMAKQWRQHA